MRASASKHSANVAGMKLHVIAAALLFSAIAHAGSIVQKPLDEFVIYDIPVALKTGTTTVMLPSEITGLFAKSVTPAFFFDHGERPGWPQSPRPSEQVECPRGEGGATTGRRDG